MGSQPESTSVAMAVGSTVGAQSVPRSLRVSWRVTLTSVAPGGAGAIVETSDRCSGRIQDAVDGPVVWETLLIPTAVGMSMYTDGLVLLEGLVC